MEKNIPDEVRKQIEEGVKELAKKSTAPDKETPDWMETDIRRGAEFGYFLACNSSHPEQGEQVSRLIETIETERFACQATIDHTEQNEDMVYAMNNQIAAFDICLKHLNSCKLSSPPPEEQDGLWDDAANMIVACYNNLGSREELNVKLKSSYLLIKK